MGHTLAAAGTDGTAGPNLDEEVADEGANEIRSAIGGHPDDFESQPSNEEFDTLVSFIAASAGSGD